MADQYFIQDQNRFPAAGFHSGTADSAETIRWTGEATGAGHVHITGGTVVTGAAGNTPGGTLDLVTRVGNVGTMELGSVVITSIPQVSVGTLPSLNLTTGTITTGSLTNIANLLNGTVVVPSGTITTGSLTNVASLINGSINILTGTLQSAGTTTGVGVVSALTNGSVNILTGTLQSAGTTTGVGVVSALTNGSVRITVGTITTGSLTNVANLLSQSSGTLNTLGTVGVVNNGTLYHNEKPVNIGTPYHVRGTTGAAVWGTIIAASGAGTFQYVSNVDVVVASGTVDVAVTYIGVGGSTGAGVFTRGQFTPGGGITKPFDPVIKSGTNGTLAYWLGGAGTVDITVTYWQGV